MLTILIDVGAYLLIVMIRNINGQVVYKFYTKTINIYNTERKIFGEIFCFVVIFDLINTFF